MDYWALIEKYLREKDSWVDLEEISREMRIQKWIVEQWFKKVALKDKRYEVKILLSLGGKQTMVRLNGEEKG